MPGLSLGPAARVASVDKLSFAAMFLSEPVGVRAVCGAGLIPAGVLLTLD